MKVKQRARFGVNYALAMGSLILFPSYASADKKIISHQDFTAEIYAKDIECHDGVPHPLFPSPLLMSFSTAYGSGIYNPSTLLLRNTSSVDFSGEKEENCSDYNALLKKVGPIPIKGTKTITESSFIRDDNKMCQRTLREDLSITIEELTLTGANEFFVLPAPISDCLP